MLMQRHGKKRSVIGLLVLFTLWSLCAATAQERSAPADQRFELPPVPEGSGAGTAGVRWDVPDSWVEQRPSSAMRRAQYLVPANPESGTGDAELVVFYFGPGQGGDPEANAARWAGQFTDPEGRPSQRIEKKEFEVSGLEILRVEVRGTYSGGMAMGRTPRRTAPDSMLLGAIVTGPDANWFFKLTGPEHTVANQEKAFDALLTSLRVGSEASNDR